MVTYINKNREVDAFAADSGARQLPGAWVPFKVYEGYLHQLVSREALSNVI